MKEFQKNPLLKLPKQMIMQKLMNGSLKYNSRINNRAKFFFHEIDEVLTGRELGIFGNNKQAKPATKPVAPSPTPAPTAKVNCTLTPSAPNCTNCTLNPNAPNCAQPPPPPQPTTIDPNAQYDEYGNILVVQIQYTETELAAMQAIYPDTMSN